MIFPVRVAIALLGLGAAACSSTIVIAREDAAFARAQARLARAVELVDRSGAAPMEKQLFLQGESYYRYRFDFPPRSVASYFAQGAAAVMDVPALQSLAGSLDLIDLRLKTYDGAIQLWETLLARYPETPLRPLALYRLGWAYRSAGASGLPRESGDEAFALLEKEAPGSPLAALAAEARSVPWKSKSTATALSVLPGLGQIYVGEHANGAARLFIALAAVAMIVTPAVVAYNRRSELEWTSDWPLLATGLGGLIILSIDYTAAFEDAMRGVVEVNDVAEAEFEERHPDAP